MKKHGYDDSSHTQTSELATAPPSEVANRLMTAFEVAEFERGRHAGRLQFLPRTLRVR